ncbi:MAG: radical SAM protein [Bacteroidales bacterium]
MAGIYIHIPFCKQKCHYCNFYSVSSVKHANDLFDALIKEIVIQKDYLTGVKIETIYLGGGTPSLLSGSQLNILFDQICNFHSVEENAEITLEANPDDLNLKKLNELKHTPVNRLSIGIQSFFDQDLKYLNRVHSADQAKYALKQTLDNGFENLSIDLIYGIPTMSDEDWKKTWIYFCQ